MLPASPPIPSLPPPGGDPARATALEKARAEYAYDRSYADLPFVAKLPLREHFGAKYLAKATEVKAETVANRAAAAIGDVLGREEAFRAMFPLLPAPLALAHGGDDAAFAWQRLAGPCPVVIRRLTEDLPALQLDAGLRRRLAAGELYVCDYAVFAGAAGGVTDGVQKVGWAPIALFGTDPASPVGLAPLAIQVAGHAGAPETRYTPADGDAWRLAKQAVQLADENFQAAIAHVGWCHMVAEVIILSAHRQLAPQHPLLTLWTPHFEYTLAVNTVTRDPVVAPNGDQDRLLAFTLDDQLRILREILADLDYDDLDPTVDFARRGTTDLPVYPFRDDGLPIWRAIRAFVAGYVALYYASDADVAGDAELQAFLSDVATEGGLPRLVGPVATVADVVDLASRVIYRFTAYHAGINDVNYDWAALVPNMPGYAVAPWPRTVDAASYAAMLPPLSAGWDMIAQTWSVLRIKANRLGEYPPFADPRVGPLVTAFQASLAECDASAVARDAGRPYPYPYLSPSGMTASINA